MRRWIALEGIDGVGKTTQVRALGQCFPKASHVLEFSETPVGDLLRSVIEKHRFLSLNGKGTSRVTDTLLLLADAAAKAEVDIGRNNGNVPLLTFSDRGVLSIVGYQSVRLRAQYGSEMADAMIAALDRVWSVLSGVGKCPETEILLIASEAEVQARLVGRGESPLAELDVQFLMEVQDVMIALARLRQFPVIDTTGVDSQVVLNQLVERVEALSVGEG